MQNSIAAANFHPFVLSEELQFSLTQFADDTVILGDSNRENILAVKVMLRGFELVSGLKVNFSKSKVIGVNLDDGFLEVASNFLSCATTSLPFNFLGIPIGANPRRKITWEPLVTKIRNKLSLWRGKHISFGGRLTLINSVLNSIPVFLFSFYRAPKLVLQEIINIQRAFLWKGEEQKRRINWVAWTDICKSKADGGLGIKDCEAFNIALLSKWAWKFCSNSSDMGASILTFRYGDIKRILLEPSRFSTYFPKASIWWRDMKEIVDKFGEEESWFGKRVSYKVGNDMLIDFWHYLWLGSQPLKLMFPSLYESALNKSASVFSSGFWIDGLWHWNDSFDTDSLPTLAVQELQELRLILSGTQPHQQGRDSFIWWRHPQGFSVKNAYLRLFSLKGERSAMNPSTSSLLIKIWNASIPSSINFSGWRAVLDRLPTRYQLWKRDMVNSTGLLCPLCREEEETVCHLFILCRISVHVWSLVFAWLGTQPPDMNSILDNMEILNSALSGSVEKIFRCRI
ncbi:unnamed protein product [Lathyrus sativus]|nr:unnamed protein product [Lathyrus sativus]